MRNGSLRVSEGLQQAITVVLGNPQNRQSQYSKLSYIDVLSVSLNRKVKFGYGITYQHSLVLWEAGSKTDYGFREKMVPVESLLWNHKARDSVLILQQIFVQYLVQ